MSLSHIPIDEIREEDLRSLINLPVFENRSLDYKERLSSDSSSDKKEFLYDVTSFANANGGELIYGISEERLDGKTTGKPYELIGVEIPNKDELIRKYENIIRGAIQPRIIGLEMDAVDLSNGQKAFVIRIPKSLNAPHMVTLEGGQRFYTRNSAGKHPMDITEIRSVILATSGLTERIKNYRLERIGQLKRNQGIIPLLEQDQIVSVHVIPYNSFENISYDINKYEEELRNLQPISRTGWSSRFNFEGFMTFSNFSSLPIPHTYVEFFRNGIIESVDKYIIKPNESSLIASVNIEKTLIERIFNYLTVLKKIGIPSPLVISISLLGVKNFKMAVSQSHFDNEYNTINTEDVLLPELMIDNIPETHEQLARILKQTFDTLWNASGWHGSLNYDKDGNWKGQK